MRKVALFLAVAVSACTTIQNPVTRSRLDAVEASYGAALALANAYRDSCAQRLIPPSCRPIVVKIQKAAVPVQSAMVKARAFAANPTITNVDLIQAASDAVNDFKVLQMELGVK